MAIAYWNSSATRPATWGAEALVPFMRVGTALRAEAQSIPRPAASSSAGASTSGFSRPSRVGPQAE